MIKYSHSFSERGIEVYWTKDLPRGREVRGQTLADLHEDSDEDKYCFMADGDLVFMTDDENATIKSHYASKMTKESIPNAALHFSQKFPGVDVDSNIESLFSFCLEQDVANQPRLTVRLKDLNTLNIIDKDMIKLGCGSDSEKKSFLTAQDELFTKVFDLVRILDAQNSELQIDEWTFGFSENCGELYITNAGSEADPHGYSGIPNNLTKEYFAKIFNVGLISSLNDIASSDFHSTDDILSEKDVFQEERAGAFLKNQSYEEFRSKLQEIFPKSFIVSFEKNTDVDKNSLLYEENNRFIFSLVGDEKDWRYGEVKLNDLHNSPLIIKCAEADGHFALSELALRLVPEKESNLAFNYLDIAWKGKDVDETIEALREAISQNRNNLAFDLGVGRPDRDFFVEKYLGDLLSEKDVFKEENLDVDRMSKEERTAAVEKMGRADPVQTLQ